MLQKATSYPGIPQRKQWCDIKLGLLDGECGHPGLTNTETGLPTPSYGKDIWTGLPSLLQCVS